MKRRSGLPEERDDDDDRKDNTQVPSTGKKSSTTIIGKMKDFDEATKASTREEMKATAATSNVDVVDVNDYCKNEKGVASTETIQNSKNHKITNSRRLREHKENNEDALCDDDENSIVSDASISDCPGAFTVKGPRCNTYNATEDDADQYFTGEVETATQTQKEEAGEPIMNDPLEAERVLETVQGISVTLDDRNDSPKKWKQLTLILGIFFFLLCAVAAVLIGFFVRSNQDGNKSLPPPSTPPPAVATVASTLPSDSPTFSPSMIPSAAPTMSEQQIMTVLYEYFPDLPASDDQQRALNWIITDPTGLRIIMDEGLTSRNKKRLLSERFVLATFYYATNGNGWRSNNLWLSPLLVCEWYGVGCPLDDAVEQKEVTSLDLRDINLIGSIPTGVGLMTSMTKLELAFNDLTGSIPTGLGLMTNITLLSLVENALIGSIPTELGLMTSMTHLDFAGNALSGSIPTELGLMTSMTRLFLELNTLVGSIPTELGLMTSMTWLSLYVNALTGPILTELGLMTNMKIIYFGDNFLTGSIPTELGLLTSLGRLSLSGNSNLTGTIPSEVVAILPNLRNCYMGDTSLMDIPRNCQRSRFR